eukprot:1392294-Amorphochlora_amoeboformis.AAC.1
MLEEEERNHPTGAHYISYPNSFVIIQALHRQAGSNTCIPLHYQAMKTVLDLCRQARVELIGYKHITADNPPELIG